MLEHQKPFEALQDHHSGYLADETGLRVTLSGAGYLLLQSTSASALQTALTGEVGLELPAPGEACVRGEYAVLWLTPAEWLLETPAIAAHFLQSALTRRLAPALAVVTDMSDAFACIQVNGVRAAGMLMRGCSLDLRAHAFTPRRTARTALADIPTIIWKTGEPQRFRCLVDRSFAAHLRNWLMDTSRNQHAARQSE